MLSHLELRNVIETAFLPKPCRCSISPDGSMTIQLFTVGTRKEELTVKGIDWRALGSGRAIAALVAEIKEEAQIKLAPKKLSDMYFDETRSLALAKKPR